MNDEKLKGLMPLAWAAKKYKLPVKWLEREARTGQLPCLIADDAILFDENTLLKTLHERARKGASNGE